jgi:hypothetical protein
MLEQQIQRQVPETETEDDEVDFSGLGFGKRLRGHGNLGSGMRNPGAVPAIQKRGPFGVEANISLTVNEPTIIRRPAAEIETAHGRPGVAGWTTPIYRTTNPTGNGSNFNMAVTLDFDMELASEYSGASEQVLRDHEQGHINIGRQKAQEHFVDNLKTRLESNISLNRANVQAALAAAENGFLTAEENDSLAYDTADYPRMRQAYIGARTPLANLEASSPNISQMASALRNFNNTILSGTQGQAEITATSVISARAGLSQDELNQLQYNPQFKQLVEMAQERINAFMEQHHYDFWIFDFSMLHAATRQILNDLRSTLDQFTWVAPG